MTTSGFFVLLGFLLCLQADVSQLRKSPLFAGIQRTRHREAFIEDCRQKAWGAVCHATWIGKELDKLMAQYQQLSDQHRAALAEIDTLKAGLDSHTVDNREKRKDLQAKADTLTR